MPTATVSSVKQPDGIYLTAGQWTSRAFASLRISIPCVSFLFLVLFVSPFLSSPIASTFILYPASSKCFSTSLLLLLLISRTAGKGAVLCKTCA